MSDFTVIRAVTKTLQAMLQNEITNSLDPQLSGVPIDLRSPKEMRDDNEANGVSLWLYRVMRDPDMLNAPARRPAPNHVERRALPINLYYLITPISRDPEDEQVLLGRVLQVFHDRAIVKGAALQDSLENTAEELRLALETPTLEELTRVWNALEASYQLSVIYLVQVALISSDLEPVETPPVLIKQTTYSQIV